MKNKSLAVALFILAALGPALYSCSGKSDVLEANDSTFEQEVLKSELPVLVDFWATWCGPCRMYGPIVDEVAKDYKGRLKVIRIDVDHSPALSQAFQIRAIPNSLLFKNGKVVKNWVGLVQKGDLTVEVDKVVGPSKL